MTAALSGNTVEYCVDGDGNWKSLVSNANSESINKGQTLSFRGNLSPTSSKGVGTFKISKSCDLTGNCNSLLFGDNAVDNLDLTGKNYAFYKLFSSCTTIRNVSSNFLPATTLANNCYYYMFNGCTSLKTAPRLPATTLITYCYYMMFCGCKLLTTAPELPATTLASNCYGSMFRNCTSLTTAPQLSATTLVKYCYHCMFYGCTSLTTAPQLPATTLANYCYSSMFNDCSKLKTAPALPATTLASHCYANMFEGCTSLTTAPELPATTLANYCYSSMFSNCSKLNYIKAMFTTTPSSSYTSYWVSGVASSGTFVKSTTWDVTATSDNSYIGIPSGWTVELISSFYSVDLNSQWQLSTTVVSPSDITVPFDGVYESYSNKGTANSGASMYININGYTNFKFYIRSYAESNYDYVMVSQLDKTLTYSSSYSDTTLVKAHTRGNQQSGTALSNYTLVEFTNIDGGAHTIQIIYRKDGSGNNNDDRGYVIIPREQ